MFQIWTWFFRKASFSTGSGMKRDYATWSVNFSPLSDLHPSTLHSGFFQLELDFSSANLIVPISRKWLNNLINLDFSFSCFRSSWIFKIRFAKNVTFSTIEYRVERSCVSWSIWISWVFKSLNFYLSRVPDNSSKTFNLPFSSSLFLNP